MAEYSGCSEADKQIMNDMLNHILVSYFANVSVEELDAELSQYNEKIYMSGDGFDICKKAFQATSTENVPENMKIQSGYSVCICALENYKNNNIVTDKELSPSYLRLSQAERERNEKLNSGVKF